LIQYLKDNSGFGQFIDGLGNAIGQAKFGGD
jgi:hypothetical protein